MGSGNVKEDCNDLVQHAVIWGAICALSCLCEMLSRQTVAFPCSFNFVCDEKMEVAPKQHIFSSAISVVKQEVWLDWKGEQFLEVFLLYFSVVNIWNCTYETIPPGLAVWQRVWGLAVYVRNFVCISVPKACDLCWKTFYVKCDWNDRIVKQFLFDLFGCFFVAAFAHVVSLSLHKTSRGKNKNKNVRGRSRSKKRTVCEPSWKY